MTKRFNSIDARNINGQTIATHVYKGATESARIKETNNFLNKWSQAHSFKHHGDVTWIKAGFGFQLPLLCDSLLGKCDTTLLDKKDK